ncbi:hypothetical protein ACIA8F_08340 [Streptomyces sp. NPDC051563]
MIAELVDWAQSPTGTAAGTTAEPAAAEAAAATAEDKSTLR